MTQPNVTTEDFEKRGAEILVESLKELTEEVAKKEEDKQAKEAYINDYARFLDSNRTVREVNRASAEMALRAGYKFYEDVVKSGESCDKVIFHSDDWQNLALVLLGEDDISEKGLRIMAAHADAPHYDLKPNPIIVNAYQDGEKTKLEQGQAKLDTHYYGGFKKGEWYGLYQLRGEVIENGKVRKLNTIDLTLPPLLPHLARDENEVPLAKAYKADRMDMMTGFTTEREVLKAIGLRSSADFSRAAIEIVPAEPVKRIGDLVTGYGQDDRVCVYAQVRAITDSNDRKTTKIVMNLDKEEIGSDGRSGSKSNWKEIVIAQAVRLQRKNIGYGGLEESAFIRERVLPKSICISADVTVGYESTYAEKFDPERAPHLGEGVAIERYTGSGGKYDASEASAETMDRLMRILDKAGVKYQLKTFSSRLDMGGGGTVARYWSEIVNVVDVGPALLGMHSHVETTHKDDIYEYGKMSKIVLECLYF